jgi:hypothetical protein
MFFFGGIGRLRKRGLRADEEGADGEQDSSEDRPQEVGFHRSHRGKLG